jgi:hypothetical protein
MKVEVLEARSKLKLHASKDDGVRGQGLLQVRVKLSLHTAEAGGVSSFFTGYV